MSHHTTGRFGIAFVAATVIITTAACGTRTEQVDDTAPSAPVVVNAFPHQSADNAERQGKGEVHPPMSADAAERQAAQEGARENGRENGPEDGERDTRTPDPRIPD